MQTQPGKTVQLLEGLGHELHEDAPVFDYRAFALDFLKIIMAKTAADIEYDQVNNCGVSLATDGTGVSIIEYDNIRLLGGGMNRYDFEIVAFSGAGDGPGEYEFVFAYNNLNGALAGPLTVGVENAAGTVGEALVNNGDASSILANGLMVCLDLIQVGEKATMTYDVTVDEVFFQLTNSAVSEVDNPGSTTTSSDWTLVSDLPKIFMPLLHKQDLP